MTLPETSCRGYYFPIVYLLGHVLVTKIQVHSCFSIDAENLRRTTLHRTDTVYRNLSLGARDTGSGRDVNVYRVHYLNFVDGICLLPAHLRASNHCPVNLSGAPNEPNQTKAVKMHF